MTNWAEEFIAHTHVFPHMTKQCEVCKRAYAYWKTVTHPLRTSFERGEVDPNEVSKEREAAFVPEGADI